MEIDKLTLQVAGVPWVLLAKGWVGVPDYNLNM